MVDCPVCFKARLFFDWLPSWRLTSIITVASATGGFIASSRYASRLPLQAGSSPGLPLCFCKLHRTRSREFARCLAPVLMQGRKFHRDRSCDTLRCFAVALLSSRLRGRFIAIAFRDSQKLSRSPFLRFRGRLVRSLSQLALPAAHCDCVGKSRHCLAIALGESQASSWSYFANRRVCLVRLCEFASFIALAFASL